jgi:hypothetical protein
MPTSAALATPNPLRDALELTRSTLTTQINNLTSQRTAVEKEMRNIENGGATPATASTPTKQHRKPISAARRKALSIAAKARWAKQQQAKGKQQAKVMKAGG